jgi:hypothetical protein
MAPGGKAFIIFNFPPGVFRFRTRRVGFIAAPPFVPTLSSPSAGAMAFDRACARRRMSATGHTRSGGYWPATTALAGFCSQNWYMPANVAGWSVSNACQQSKSAMAASSG